MLIPALVSLKQWWHLRLLLSWWFFSSLKLFPQGSFRPVVLTSYFLSLGMSQSLIPLQRDSLSNKTASSFFSVSLSHLPRATWNPSAMLGSVFSGSTLSLFNIKVEPRPADKFQLWKRKSCFLSTSFRLIDKLYWQKADEQDKNKQKFNSICNMHSQEHPAWVTPRGLELLINLAYIAAVSVSFPLPEALSCIRKSRQLSTWFQRLKIQQEAAPLTWNQMTTLWWENV